MPDRQTKVCGSDGRVLVLIQEEEVVRLDVTVNDALGVTLRDEADDGPHDLRDPALSVAIMIYLVQNASAGAQLHYQVHTDIILIDILN